MNNKNSSIDKNYGIFLRADTEWEAKNYSRAFNLFLEAAERGDPHSQHNLAFMYSKGEGCRRNPKKAIFWYKRSWRQCRQSDSCFNLSEVYRAEGNTTRSRFRLSRAISLGDGDAMVFRTKQILRKPGIKSHWEAITLLKRAIKSNQILAETRKGASEMLKRLKLGKLSLETISQLRISKK